MKQDDAEFLFQNFLVSVSNLKPSLLQYYYAHKPKGFTTEGAIHFKGDGKIYGGDPVLIKTYSEEQVSARGQAAAASQPAAVPTKKITQYSWCDEETKVKVYLETSQFRGTITEDCVSVNFEDYLCDIKVTDEEGNINVLNLYKLQEKIEPQNSSVRFRPNRITITMKKWLETSWSQLIRPATKK